MARPRPEKKRQKAKTVQPPLPGMPPPEPPGTARVLPMQLQIGDRMTDSTGEWQVIGRPYTTAGGKNSHVRVQRVDKPGVTETRLWGSYEKVTVIRRDRRGGQAMRISGLICAAAILVAGCANGPMFWTRPDATARTVQVDHHQCFDAAYLGYGTGNEQTYKSCMHSKGWTRTQGSGSQYPDGVFFRGPEGDDEFTPAARGGFGWLEYWSRQ